MRRHRRSAVSVVGVSVAAVTIASLATLYDGSASADVSLNDGGVWVTKQSSGQLAHLNHVSGLLDGAAFADADKFDVLQSAKHVLITAPGSASMVDPVGLKLGAQVSIPGTAQLQLGGETLTVVEQNSGNLWVLPASGLEGFTESAEPTMKLGKGGAVAVGRDGVVHTVSPASGEIATINGPGARPVKTKISVAKGDSLSITAVGSTGVVLNESDGRVLTSERELGRIDDPGSAALQQPSDDAGSVAITTANALVRVPFDTEATIKRHNASSSGTAVAPVQMNGCVYSVWQVSGAFLRDCGGVSDDLSTNVPSISADSALVFRVNRDAVVLNDVVGGVSWLTGGTLRKVDNWNEIVPPDSDKDKPGETAKVNLKTTMPDRGEKNTPPIAENDEFGARAGRSTLLAVTDNDTDPDGDLLTVALEGPQPSWGSVTSVLDGKALQIDVPAGQQGQTAFAYRVQDGRGGVATATVEVSVVPEGTNNQPQQQREMDIPVEVGGTVTYAVLGDWRDPDGDDLYLQSATTVGSDRVSATPDGRVTFTAASGSTGIVDVVVTVSDGRSTKNGLLRFNVQPVGSMAPVTLPDHVSLRAGETATAYPLRNDVSGAVSPMRLASITTPAGVTLTPDYDSGAVTLSSDAVGTHYAIYTVSTGAMSATGVLRIDVRPADAAAAPPIAVRDIAMVLPGGDVVVDVLKNDVDPAGGVLVVQGIDTSAAFGLSASVTGNATVRITTPGGLDAPQTISYRVSNGNASTTGSITVIPLAATTEQPAPVTATDFLTVRANDVGTVNPVANDSSPVGLALTLSPELVSPLDSTLGKAFISDGTIRVRASGKAGTGNVTYEVTDANGQKATGTVVVTVAELGGENAAPKPHQVDARVVAGTPVRITIDLDGSDPNGDSVEMVSLDSAPQRGMATEVAGNSLLYTADENESGTDVFGYRVRDRLGAEAVGTIRVGIAPREQTNQSPFAVTDSVQVRPGREVSIPVTANDEDPDRDPISLVPDSLMLPETPGLEARTDGQNVVVVAPQETGKFALQYAIEDGNGGSAVGTVNVTVDPNVPLQAPIARDDRIVTEDVDDNNHAVVDVLANDIDLDGNPADLKVAVVGDVAAVTADRKVDVEVTMQRQLIEYTVTDADKLVGRAFIFVPARSEMVPVLIDPSRAVQVRTGETVPINIAGYVRVIGGGTPTMTADRDVTARHSNGQPLRQDDSTLVYTSAEGYLGSDAITFEVAGGEGTSAVLSLLVNVVATDAPQEEREQPRVGQTRPPAPQDTPKPGRSEKPETEPSTQPTDDDTNNPNPTPTQTAGPTQAPTATSTPNPTETVALAGTAIALGRSEDARTVNLRSLTTGSDAQTVSAATYRLVGADLTGIDASITGDALTVVATSTAAIGSAGTLVVEVTSGKAKARGSFPVTVVSSTKPRAVAVTDTAEGRAGQQLAINVLRNDINPYGPDQPLRVLEVVALTVPDTVVSGSDGTVLITPKAGVTGKLQYRYTIADASNDESRNVNGLIEITVKGLPGAPGTPSVTGMSSQRVSLTWTAPSDNGGAPITEYRVRSVSGGAATTCTTTACDITGLTNGTAYAFTVTAVNEVGESNPSPASASVTPVDKPKPPTGFILTTGDSSINVKWGAVSGASSYIVELTPTALDGRSQLTVAGNAVNWGGLTNGVAYRFRVKTVANGVQSEWSTQSDAATPSKVPDGLPAPVPTRSGMSVTVNWVPPGNNGGAPIQGYRLVQRTDVGNSSITAGGTTAMLTLPDGATWYEYTVQAYNKNGYGLESAPSARQSVPRNPGAPGTPRVSAGDSVVIVDSFSDAALNGADANTRSYQYSLNGGAWTALPGDRRLAATNGTAYTVRLRALTAFGGETMVGSPSGASNSVTPTAPNPPGRPHVAKASHTGSVTFTWHAGSGPATADVEISNDVGMGWTSMGPSGSYTHTGHSGDSVTYYFRAIGEGGAASEVVQWTERLR